jgi:MFS family permease
MDDPESASLPRSRTGGAVGGGRYASLALPQYRWLLGGTVLSQIAAWMEEISRGWLAAEVLDASAFQLGLLGFTRGFSQLLMSPVAGVLADRLDRRRLAAITQFVPAVDALLIAILVGTGHIAMWQLYPLVAVSGLAGAVNVPVRQVLVYDVVGGEYIVNAIALNSVVANVSRIIAPAAAGVVIATVGISASYYAQVVFFALATMATFALHPITHAEPVRMPMFQSIRDGFGYVRGDPVLARLVLLNVLPNLLIYPYVALMPIFAKDILDVGSAGYGVLLTGVGIGSIPGGLIVAGMAESRWKGRVMGLSACMYMGMVTLFAFSTIFVLSFAILIVAGIGWSMMVTLNQTLLQLNVADAYRGRVLSLYTMATGATPFGNLGMGALADGAGVRAAVASFALTGLAAATVLGIGSRRVREL